MEIGKETLRDYETMARGHNKTWSWWHAICAEFETKYGAAREGWRLIPHLNHEGYPTPRYIEIIANLDTSAAAGLREESLVLARIDWVYPDPTVSEGFCLVSDNPTGGHIRWDEVRGLWGRNDLIRAARWLKEEVGARRPGRGAP